MKISNINNLKFNRIVSFKSNEAKTSRTSETFSLDKLEFKEKNAKYLTKDAEGQILAHKCDLDQLKIMNKKLKNNPEILKKIYLTPDKNGNLPAHKYASWDYDYCKKLKYMSEALKEQPDILAQIFLTKNNEGEIPAYNYEQLGLEVMNEALQDQPDVLAEIYTTENNEGEILANKFFIFEQFKAMNAALKNQPDVLAEIYEKENKQGYSSIERLYKSLKPEKFKFFFEDLGLEHMIN